MGKMDLTPRIFRELPSPFSVTSRSTLRFLSNESTYSGYFFAYNPPNHLCKTLEGLRVNRIPLIYAFSDGPRTFYIAHSVDEAREILLNIDLWKNVIYERVEKLGLGR